MPVVLVGDEPTPRVHKNNDEQVPKRVQFIERPEPRVGQTEPNRLIVEFLPPQVQPIFKQEPKHSKPATTTDSIASRVNARRTILPNDSITSRVVMQRRGQEVANPVLDEETC